MRPGFSNMVVRLSLLSLLLLAGCTVPGSLKEVEPLTATLKPYSHVTIHVNAKERSLKDDTSAFAQRLSAKLKKERAFPYVSQGHKKGAEGDILLNVELKSNRTGEDKDASPYRSVAEVIRARDDKRLARLEVPGDDYGVVASKDPLGRALDSMSNRIARYLKSHR